MSDTTPVPPRPNHLPLIISLCVNLLLAGVVAVPLVRFAMYGPMFGRPPMHETFGQGAERMQVRMMLSPRALMHAAPEKSDKIKSIIEAHHDKIAALRADSMAAHQKVVDVFSAPQFDKAAFAKSLAEMQAADAAFESEILKAVSETVAILSPEERRKAAEFHGRPQMMDHHRFWFHGRGNADGPPPPHEDKPDSPPHE
jgi:uncharacterized membrane protein